MTPRDAEARRTDRLIGRRLRDERLVAGMASSEFAERLGIDAETLRRHEAGELRLEPPSLVQAASVLGIPLSFFCYGLGDGPAPSDEGGASPRWHSLPRPPAVLQWPEFARAASLIEVWRDARGVLTDDVLPELAVAHLLGRCFLLRRLPRASRSVFEFCAPGVRFLTPCESLVMVGRDFSELPDRDYGAWVAEAYEAAVDGEGPSVQSIRAEVRTSGAAIVRARYDRVQLPWRARGDRFVMGLSIARETSIVR